MITTPSGLQYEDTVVGTGAVAKAGQKVKVHYTGWLYNNGQAGAKFDSSKDRGQPFVFPLAAGHVIQGWDEGVQGMAVGGTRRLVIPAALGYGARGAGGVIPPQDYDALYKSGAEAIFPPGTVIAPGDIVRFLPLAELLAAQGVALKAVALNLADVEDMRHQLDAIATDVVNYQCDVSIQVPRTQDYPWLATLLTKRVKRIDSGYDLKIHRQILKNIPAQIVLIPRKAE